MSMNREDRRNLKKKGLSDKAIKELETLGSPCTIAEAIKIARGAARDAIADYQNHMSKLIMSQSIHLETLRELVSTRLEVTSEEYEEILSKHHDIFLEKRREFLEEIEEKETGEIESRDIPKE